MEINQKQVGSHEEVETELTFTIPFTQVSNDVLDCLGFENPIDKLTYINLLRFAYQKGHAFPSINKLAMMANSSDNRIRQSLDRLQNMKLIKIIERKNANGEDTTHLYKIYDLSNELKAYSAMNKDAVEKYKQAEKERKAEKRRKQAEKKAQNEDPSKFEGGTSKFEGGTSKFEGGTSKFEPEEYLSNKKGLRKRLNNNLSIKEEEIEKADLPDPIKNLLHKKIDRLIELDISIEDIYDNLKANEDRINDWKYREVLMRVFDRAKKKIGTFSNYMNTAIDDYLKPDTQEQQPTGNDEKEPQADHNNPEWYKQGKHKENTQSPHEETPYEEMTDEQKEVADRLKELTEGA